MPLPVKLPDVAPAEEAADSSHGGWAVIVFNNEYNTWDEVIHVLMIATKCSFDEAYCETWEIDHYGKAPVHFGSESECERAAGIIRSIGIVVQVERDG